MTNQQQRLTSIIVDALPGKYVDVIVNQFYITIGRNVGADFKLTGIQGTGNLLIRLTGASVWTDPCSGNLVVETIALCCFDLT